MKQEVLFTHEECDEILNSVNEDNWTNSLINGYTKSENYKPNVRTCIEQNIRESIICDMVLFKCKPLGIASLPSFKIIKYTKGSFFKKHVDRTNDNYQYRLKTIVIQLSNPEDYKGGDLIVGDVVSTRERGNCIIFDSGCEHEVTLLEKGNRYSVVIWLTSATLRRDTKTII